MLKNILNLTLLFSLSTALAYLALKNETNIVQYWQQFSRNHTPQMLVNIIPSSSSGHQQANQPPTPLNSVRVSPFPAKQPKNIAKSNPFADEASVESSNDDFKCTSLPLDSVTVKKQKTVMRWTDENGKTHFGDAAPYLIAAKKVQLKRKKELEYFNLSMSGDELPTRFSERLSTRITRVYQLLSELIPQEKLEKVTVDLKMFNKRSDYNRYSNSVSLGLANNSNGFYTMRFNQAVVHRRNDQHGSEVALHESTHVINAGIFGYTPRWLNEGLAEYMENMTLSGQMAEINPNTSWTKRSRINYQLVGLNELFATKSRHWTSSKRRSYYATSWALIYYLMSSAEDRQWLGVLLTEKASHRCERTITRSYIDKRYPGGIANLQQRFNHWVNLAKLPTHRY